MSRGMADWTEAHVRRLFWRAGFGARPDEVAKWTAARPRRDDRLDPERRRRAADGRPRAAHPGRPARPGQRVGPRRPLVAGPHGPLAAPAGGEDDALLARPLRHERPGHAADARARTASCRRTPWARSRSLARRSRPTRRCSCSCRCRTPTRGAERELRPRADGAVHARQGLHREGHPRGRPRAHRLPRALGQRRLPRHELRQGATTTGSSGSSASAASHDWRTCSTWSARTARTLRSSSPSCGRSSSPPSRRPRPRCATVRRPTGRRSSRSSRSSRRSWSTRAVPEPRAPDMVKSPLVYVAGTLRTTRIGRRAGVLTWLLDCDGPAPVPPTVGRGLGVGPAWMSTNTMRIRFDVGNDLINDGPLAVAGTVRRRSTCRPPMPSPRAWHAVGEPWVSGATRGPLVQMATALLRRAQPTRPQGRRSAPTCASAHSATSCSSGPDAHRTDAPPQRPPRLRRLPPDLGGDPPHLPGRQR